MCDHKNSCNIQRQYWWQTIFFKGLMRSEGDRGKHTQLWLSLVNKSASPGVNLAKSSSNMGNSGPLLPLGWNTAPAPISSQLPAPNLQGPSVYSSLHHKSLFPVTHWPKLSPLPVSPRQVNKTEGSPGAGLANIITRKQGRNPDTSEMTSSLLITLSSLADLLKESLTN